MSAETYAFSTDIEVQISEIDRGDHVNNAVFVEYLQQARIKYLDELVGYYDSDTYIVVVTLELEFLKPVSWRETVTVDVRIPKLGTSSFCIEYRLRVGETVVARAETVMVTFDRASEESIPIPHSWRDRIETDNNPFLVD